MSKRIIGKCGECGGPVTVPLIWHGINPPTPQCDDCGATHHKEDTMPTLPMRPRDPRQGRTRGRFQLSVSYAHGPHSAWYPPVLD